MMSIRIDDIILSDNATKATLSDAISNLRLGENGDALLFPSEGNFNNDSSTTPL